MGSLEGHASAVEAVGFSPKFPFLATGDMEGQLKIWDSNTLQLRQTCQHDDGIIALRWFKERPLIATISMDCMCRVWDARTGACLQKFEGHFDTPLAMDLSADESFILTGSDDKTALIFLVDQQQQ